MDKRLIDSLLNNYGSPLYVFDESEFIENYRALCEAFREVYPNYNPGYSYKTNYIPALCRIVNKLGGYAEVVSEMEMEIALRCGVQPEKIIWNGPVKNAQQMEWLLLNGGTVHADSLKELQTIQ